MGRARPAQGRVRGLTDEELKARIRACLPLFEAKVAAGEVRVRALQYSKPRGRSIRPDPGVGPLPVFVGGAVVGKW